MTWWTRLSGTALALALVSAPVAAQSLQGDVTDSITRRPVAGGLVVLLGGHDSIIASATTSERGAFALPVVKPGEYRIRILRIGSRAWLSPSIALLPGQAMSRHFIVASAPVMLAEIVVVGTSTCKSDLNADANVATLWEEARKALNLAEGTARGPRFDYRMHVTTRKLDPTGQMATEQTLGRLGTGAWPIKSAPVQSLADHGYVQPADSIRGPRYYGPDAEVFFSDQFRGSHCFRIVAPPKRKPELIGVGFEPEKTRTLPDITGVMWIDRQSAELREIEFGYTGLWRWVPPGSAGGALEFVRLASGAWIISGWRVTAPVAAVEPLKIDQRADESVFPYFGNKRVKLAGYLEEHGYVEEVRAADSTVVWRAPGPGN